MDDLPDNVHFLGLVERDRMNEFFNMEDVIPIVIRVRVGLDDLS